MREIKIPGIYKHFKHTEDGIPNNYMYCTMGISKPIKVKLVEYNTPVISVVHTESEIHIPILIIDGEYRHLETYDSGELVIYKSLYDSFGIYARPKEMFMSKVDKEKYPGIEAVYRFEEVR